MNKKIKENIIDTPKYDKLMIRLEIKGEKIINLISLLTIGLLIVCFLINSLILGRDSNIAFNALALSLLTIYHIILWLILKKDRYKPLFKYLTTLFHITIISIAVWGSFFDKSLPSQLKSMMPLLYFIPILFSGFYNKANVSIFAGAIAAIQYCLLYLLGKTSLDMFPILLLSIIAITFIVYGIMIRGKKAANELLTLRHETIKIQSQQMKIKQKANIDELTQLSNRKNFDDIFNNAIHDTMLGDSFFSVILLDMDYFKSLNDSFGNNMGDKVLKALASLLIKSTRDSDLVARWGGEEFVILCSDTHLSGAFSLACKIQKEFSKIQIQGLPPVTFSAGIIEIEPKDDKESVLKRLNKEIYNAKEGGRNCIRPDLSSELNEE